MMTRKGKMLGLLLAGILFAGSLGLTGLRDVEGNGQGR